MTTKTIDEILDRNNEPQEPIEIRLREIVDEAQVTSHYDEALDIAIFKLTELITQAMLKALPEKVQPREDPYTDGWNDAIDQIEAAIKLMGE